jgi:D-alanyl-D-alanine carboxypeptidase (penicillin-binding protein 5/6)
MGAALLVVLAAPAVHAAPPKIGAPAAIVIDAQTGERLWSRNPDQRRYIASTTKLMTAMIVLARTKPEQIFTAPSYNPGAGETKIGLHQGERMTVHDLLRAMMLPSANDAAYDLAVNVGGSKTRFVRLMNKRARALGLTNTHYSTPVGLDDPSNYSTANDLSRLARILMRNRMFAKVVDLPTARLRSGSHPRTVVNRNDLVRRYPFVDGVKTGHTLRAGYVLVGAAKANGAQVISVVMATPSESQRDAQSLALLRWGVAQFRRALPVVHGREYARANVRYYDGVKVRLVAARSYALSVRRGYALRRRVQAPHELEGPIAKGTRVGQVEVIYRGHVVRTVPLVTASEVKGAGFVRRATSALGGPLPAIALLALIGAAVLFGLRARAIRLTRATRGARQERAGQ